MVDRYEVRAHGWRTEVVASSPAVALNRGLKSIAKADESGRWASNPTVGFTVEVEVEKVEEDV